MCYRATGLVANADGLLPSASVGIIAIATPSVARRQEKSDDCGICRHTAHGRQLPRLLFSSRTTPAQCPRPCVIHFVGLGRSSAALVRSRSSRNPFQGPNSRRRMHRQNTLQAELKELCSCTLAGVGPGQRALTFTRAVSDEPQLVPACRTWLACPVCSLIARHKRSDRTSSIRSGDVVLDIPNLLRRAHLPEGRAT